MRQHRPDQFRRLIDILLPGGGYILALWEVYIDESGDESSDSVFVLGGYLIRSDKAAIMQEKWMRAVRKAGVPYMHMVDCAHGNEKFKGIPKEKRAKLASRCMELIRNYVEVGMCFVMNPPRWGIDSGREEVENVYGTASMMLVSYFSDYIRRMDTDPKLAIFFEDGHSTEHLSRRAIQTHMRLNKAFPNGSAPSLTYAAKVDVCLLQAADIFAWQTAKYVRACCGHLASYPAALKKL